MGEEKKEEKAVSRRKYLAAVGGAIAAAAVGWGVAGYALSKRPAPAAVTTATETITKTITAPAPATPTPTVPAGVIVPGEVTHPDWWRKAAEPYKGVTITAVDDSTPSSLFTSREVAPIFEKLTGIKVKVENTSWEEMYRKSILDMEKGTGLYDWVYCEQDIAYAYYRNKWTLSPFDMAEKHPELVYPYIDWLDMFTLNQYSFPPDYKPVGIPMEAFLKTYFYRRDLFSDPKERKDFKDKYGWDLRPPKTWDEYEQIAEFFTRPDKELYGHIAQAKSHPCVGYEIFETVFPTFGVETPGVVPPEPICNWGINLETGGASVEKGGLWGSPESIEALAYYVHLLKYAPPGVKTFTWYEVPTEVAAGRIAQGLAYMEFMGGWLDPEKSKVVGKIGVDFPPVHPKYYKPGSCVGYFDGAAYAIPWCAKHPEAAFLFLQFFAQHSIDLLKTIKHGTAIRVSTLHHPLITELDDKYGGYFSLMRDPAKRGRFAGSPRLRNHLSIMEVVWPEIGKMVAGEQTPEETAKKVGKLIDAKIEELGEP
jgi:multiple sugar transport system substrate-binding protein